MDSNMVGAIAILIPITISLGAFAMIGWLAWVKAQRRQAELRSQAERYSRVMEKFGSASEFTAFLQTEEGRRFLQASEASKKPPYGRFLNALQVGLVLLFLGGAFFILKWQVFVERREISFPGIILVAIGAGLLLSAAISYALAKRWNLLHDKE